MVEGVVLGDVSVLDRYQVRDAVIRIPEVGLRLRELQAILDRAHRPQDVHSALLHDDMNFYRLGVLRGAIVATVQMGLYDRWKRGRKTPELFVGPRGTSPLLRILAGQARLSDVFESLLIDPTRAPLGWVTPQQKGIFDIIKCEGPEIHFIESDALSVEVMVQQLVDDHSVSSIINIGPGSTVDRHSLEFEYVSVLESTEVDPFLGWFLARCAS